jgi:hypothetical protein
MSLRKMANKVRKTGFKNVNEDSVLAHISPKEAMMLKAYGGSGRPDPQTGIPHFNEDSGGEGFGNSGGFGGFGGYGGVGGDTSVGSGFAAGGFTDGTGGFGSQGTAADSSGGQGFSNLIDAPVESFASYNPAFDSQLANEQNGFSAADAFGYDGPPASAQEDSLSSMFDSAIAKKAKNFAISQIASKLGVPGMALGIAGLTQAKGPEQQAAGFGQIAGGFLGSALGGPVGGIIGSSLGAGLSGWESSRGLSASDRAGIAADSKAAANAPGARAGSGQFGLGDLVTGGLGLYQGYQASQDAKNATGVAQSQTQSLASMYGPDSPYAQQLRQQLLRKDAASGRRSQYGPREVELQARLAEMATRNAPNVLAANRQALEQQQLGRKTNGQLIASGLSLANQSGLTGYAQRGLGSLFNGNTADSGYRLGSGGFSDARYDAGAADTSVASSGGNFWDDWF